MACRTGRLVGLGTAAILGLLLMAPMIFTSTYASYKDIFEKRST